MIRRQWTAALALVATAGVGVGDADAQAGTDIFVASLRQSGRSLAVGPPVNVTHRPGYDNQPSFTPDGAALLYTAIGASGQADTWSLRLADGSSPDRVTNTAIGVYSPTVMPDGRSFSVIRVEPDSTQRLWKFPLGGGEPALVLERIKPVGYHVWLDARTVFVFILGNPSTLQMVDVATGNATRIASSIGRALVKVPHHAAVNFVQVVRDSGQWVAEYDVAGKRVRRLGRLPEGADYIAWTPGGALITAAGSTIYRWDDGTWTVVADLTAAGVRNITRLAISPAGDRLAFVAEDEARSARAVNGIGAVDSLVAAEFAKDSIGSITVGVVADSELVWTRSVGFADIKAHRAANRTTVYRIGSITKPFTAVMLMQLVAAGRVRLSDPVERYLPQVAQIADRPRGAAPVTFLQLATMTAGLAREPNEDGPFWTGPVSDWEATLLAALPHTHYRSMPGTEFSYSNIGYAILGAALARVAGQPYTEWERARVFAPLGMSRTRFEVDPTIARDLAVGYEVNDDGALDDTTAAREARDGRGYKVPNGAIFTTVDDLARFVAFELGRGPETVLSREALDEAFGGLVASDGFLESGYGLGFMAMRRGDYAFLGHGGSVAGYRAAMVYDRGRRLGVIVLRNVGGGKQDPGRLAGEILSSLATAKGAAIQADIDRRVKAQRPSPLSEAAVRRIIGELGSGTPDYTRMGSALARTTRRQIAQHQATIAALGPLESLTFTRVGAGGPDIYRAAFDKGVLEWRIWLDLDGTVDYFTYRRVSPPGQGARTP